MQGRDLAPLVRGETVPWRMDFFYEHLFHHGGKGVTKSFIPKTEGVVSERYKYLCYIEEDPPYEQLFDLETDPYEQNNLVGQSNYERTLRAFRIRCHQLRLECR
jgi:hypothetical protein